jgi:EAL domain-containing protein (putative c-di-GMP-specific phosphodiesterase class I)
MLLDACRHARAWQLAGLPAVPVAVNLSALEFRQPKLVESVTSILADTPQYLELELTESMLMHGDEAMVIDAAPRRNRCAVRDRRLRYPDIRT